MPNFLPCAAAVLLLSTLPLRAQTRREAADDTADRSSPPAQTFHDARSGIAFDVPAGWLLSRRDGEVSTFHLDARTAPRSAQFRAVANINYNPFPASTFSGAFVYFSITPRSSQSSCSRQAATPGKPDASRSVPARADFGQLSFHHGRDQHFHICVDARDEVYTAFRQGSCLRFDLAMNNFCGGEVSGVKDMTRPEIDNILHRMQSILDTVRIEDKP